MDGHRLWKEGYTLEDLFTSFIILPLCATPSITLSMDTPKMAPILELSAAPAFDFIKVIPGLSITFSYTIT